MSERELDGYMTVPSVLDIPLSSVYYITEVRSEARYSSMNSEIERECASRDIDGIKVAAVDETEQ